MAKQPWERGPLSLERIAQDARECARTLRLDEREVLKRVQIVVSAFGWDWVQEEWERSQRKGFLRSNQHPLVRHVYLLERPNLYGLLELGRYLVEFSDDPDIDDVIQHMKGQGQFENHLFALAMSYRFSRAGARVSLEPQTDRGRADFLLVLEGIKVCCECYRQGYSGPQDQINGLKKEILGWRWASGQRSSVVRITLSALPKQGADRQIRDLVRRAREAFEETGIPSVEAEEFCRVSVQPLPASLQSNPDKDSLKQFLGDAYACCAVSVPADEQLPSHTKGDPLDLGRLDCRDIWALYLEGEAALELSPLTKNLRRKLSQAKRPGTGRLLCVESRSRGKPFELSAESAPVRQELKRIFAGKPDVVGVVFAERYWNEISGPGYHLQPAVSMDSHFRLPAGIWEALFEYEKHKEPMD